MGRYTRKDAESAFARLVKILDQREATAWNDVGGWALDYQPTYGGYVIEEISNTSGGISQPFGPQRRPTREFCAAVRFVEDAIRVKEHQS